MPHSRNPKSSFVQEEKLKITKLSQLKTISAPQRLEILEAVISEPRTVKQVAELLGQPATKLYYHMAALEKAGFVAVARTRVISGIIEKYYLATAQTIELDQRLLKGVRGKKNQALEAVLRMVLDATGDDIRRSFAAGLVDLSADPGQQIEPMIISRNLLRLNEADIPKFTAGLQALISEIASNESSENEANYALTVVFYPRTADGKKRGQ